MPAIVMASPLNCLRFWLAALALCYGQTGAQDIRREFDRDLGALCQPRSRSLGTAGYEQTIGYLKTEIAKLNNVQLQVHEYPVTAPVTDDATLRIGPRTESIYPFWPAQVRLNSTPAEGITGKLVYVGDCTYAHIRPADIRGQIAVIEAGAGENWSNAAYFGARAILVLGTKHDSHVDLRWHDLTVPVDLPRFYVPPGAFADELRSGKLREEAKLIAKVNWRSVKARNLYALVLPEKRVPDGWTGSQPPGALVYEVPLEATCLVPDLASGASQAAHTATGLALLRDASRHPLNRPVMICFEGADVIQLRGTREMLMALADVPKNWQPMLAKLAEDLQPVDRELKRLQQIQSNPASLDINADRDAIDRVVKTIEADAEHVQDDLFRARSSADKKEPIPFLEDKLLRLNQTRFAFQQHSDRLDAAQARYYVDQTIARLTRLLDQYDSRREQLNRRIQLYRWLSGQLGKEADPSDRSNNSRLIEMVIGIDLSDRGDRIGPMYWGHFQRATGISQIQDYRDWFFRMQRGKPAWFEPLQTRIDLEPLNGARSPQSWLCAPLALSTEMSQAWGVPGISMITLDDLRLRRDTPADTIDQINIDAILPQLEALRDLMRHAWNDPKFKGPVELKWQHGGFEGQVVGTAPGRPVPDLPREGFLATYYYVSSNTKKIPPQRNLPWTLGVRRGEAISCDAEGNYFVEGLPRLNPELQLFAVQVYRMEENTGAITDASDLGKQTEGISIYADIKQEVTPLRSLVFRCSQVSLTGLYDPRFLQDLGEVLLLDARRNAEPQRFSVSLNKQFMTAFVEPDMLSYLLFRYGRVGNRLILVDAKPDAAHVSASGFSVSQLNSLGPLSIRTAADFRGIDAARLAEYRAAGVSSNLLDDLHAQSGRQLSDAKNSESLNDGLAMARNSDGAWASEARVYQAAQDMANDVVYAAIFLLLLCVPFSFCMERLLVGTPNIYKQIAGSSAIFAVMSVALWSFHPAFKISMSPLIIILAFAILFMSLVVIVVVYGKFDTELKRIRSGRGTSATTSFASASVLMSAVVLGVANMRKRKFRTALTSITIILITFAVLCFTSATRYLDTTTLPTGVPSSHPGILLRQRGFRTMSNRMIDTLASVLPDKQLVQRWWNVDAWDTKAMIHIAAGNRIFPAAAMLGLSPGEQNLSSIAQVIGPEKWSRLEKGDQNIVYLSSAIADQLQVKENDTVRVGGIDLQVAGIFDANRFDEKVTTLSGEPIGPLRYSTGMLDAGGRAMSDSAVESLDLDSDTSASELANVYEHLPSTQFAIVPATVSRQLPNATLRSLSLRLKDEGEVKKVSDELSKRFSLALFAGYNDGVKMVAASNLTSVSGAGQVAIPLAIAGLIIFNTMMGSIAERRREIHVYTSLGLAPMHVGALFVAEALTYGLIGSVFGYILGQGAGTLLLNLGWLGNVTLNYSGTSAVLTMTLILLIVLLSALVPARLASQIAAPSIERTWKVPLPKGDEIMAHLPFTINKTAADGALAYLAEFFDAHREGSIGRFSSANVEPFSFDTSRGLKTTIWLTPFDLGVRQHLMLLIHPGEFPDIYEVQVILQRLSGDDRSWYRMNRTFLTELRRQFLQWRTLSPKRMLEYVEESRKLFGPPAEQAKVA